MATRFIVDTPADGLFVIRDANDGNTTVLVGDDDLLVVDTKTSIQTDGLLAEIARIADKPVRYVINTHWHPDHVGGNERLAKAGATIIAHEVARKRMSEEQYIEVVDRTIPPLPERALPRITFATGLTLHCGRETVRVSFRQFGHTDGDAIVFFQQANVIQLGDTYFNGVYPFVTVSAGASYARMLEIGREVLSMADDQTRIVSGHGPVATATEYTAYLDMLGTIHGRVGRQIAAGKTSEEVIASKPTRDFDAAWAKGVLTPDMFVRVICEEMAASAR